MKDRLLIGAVLILTIPAALFFNGQKVKYENKLYQEEAVLANGGRLIEVTEFKAAGGVVRYEDHLGNIVIMPWSGPNLEFDKTTLEVYGSGGHTSIKKVNDLTIKELTPIPRLGEKDKQEIETKGVNNASQKQNTNAGLFELNSYNYWLQQRYAGKRETSRR